MTIKSSVCLHWMKTSYVSVPVETVLICRVKIARLLRFDLTTSRFVAQPLDRHHRRNLLLAICSLWKCFLHSSRSLGFGPDSNSRRVFFFVSRNEAASWITYYCCAGSRLFVSLIAFLKKERFLHQGARELITKTKGNRSGTHSQHWCWSGMHEKPLNMRV